MVEFDSTKTLEEIRQLLGIVETSTSGSEAYQAFLLLCSKVAQLDTYLTNDGAYPKQWTNQGK
jgi:hypothetical protein